MTMTATPEPLKFQTPDGGEEAARADLYGLLASLFYTPPTQALLDTIAAAPVEGEGALQLAWAVLADACRNTCEEQVREEYESLFIGVGKPEVMLYGSYYLSGFLMEKPLAALRADLAVLGLEREENVPESEDHIATLCEVMRYLIASDDMELTNIAAQKKFFADHIQPWVKQLCEAAAGHPQAVFYRAVTMFAGQFFDVEMQAFDMP
jgi:TorA maturation chaperone TorD